MKHNGRNLLEKIFNKGKKKKVKKNNYKSLLDKIINLDSFEKVFEELKIIDEKKTLEIENSLKKSIEDTHSKIIKNKNDKKSLKYWLYKESVELQAHSSSYFSYSEMMATREKALWEFAIDLTEIFFDFIGDELDAYFKAKIKIMHKELEKDVNWYSGIRDTSKKMASILNSIQKIFKSGFNYVGLGKYLNDKEIVNTNSIVEDLLERHLSKEIVGEDIQKILELASKRYEELWKKELKTQAPDLNKLNSFINSENSNIDVNVEFGIGPAEQTFTVGIAGAVVGTFGLAAGWHTITYAMLNVFPPMAIFTVFSSVVVAVLTKEKALDTRKKQVSEAVKQYYRHFLSQIDREKLKELNGKTLREAIIEQNKKIIKKTVDKWTKAISGNLKIEHYKLLDSAFTQHFRLIDDCLKII